MNNDVDSASKAPIFAGLRPEDAASIDRAASLQVFKAGDDLLIAGKSCPGLYVIRSGAASAIVTDTQGVEHQAGILGRGDCAGEMALLTGEACSATVRALTAGEAWFIERGDFLALLERTPQVLRNASQLLSRRLARTTRYAATQPRNNVVAFVTDVDPETEVDLAFSVASLVAERVGRCLLIADTGARPRQRAKAKTLSSIAALLRDRSLTREHEATNGEHSLSVAYVTETDDPPVAAHDLWTALDWLRPFYAQVLLVADSDRISASGSHHAPWVSAIVSGGVTETPQWLERIVAGGFAAEVAVLSPAAPSLIEAVERRTKQAVARLAASRADLTASGSPAYRETVERLARRVSRTEIGLALGSGAARGFAHIGVLKAFEEEGVPIDYIAGCSIGAVVGGLYAGGIALDEITRIIEGADKKLARWTIPIASLWSDSGLKRLLQKNGGQVRFSELQIPFAAIACDVASGEPAVLQRGTVWKAVRASVSVPGMFPAAFLRGRWLTDGGLVDPIPVDTVRRMGGDIVVGVDLLSLSGRARQGAKKRVASTTATGRVPSLIDMLWRSMEIMQEQVSIRSASSADVTIEPDLGRVLWKDFSRRGRKFIAEGERAAREKVPEVKRLLRRG